MSPTFVEVRCLLFILLLSPFCGYAQDDSLVFSFSKSVKNLNDLQRSEFKNKIDKKRVSQIKIQAYIVENATVAINRLETEYRIRSVKELCLNNSLYENIIFEERLLTNDSSLLNKVKIYFEFIDPKKGKVVFKTATVQITERDPIHGAMPELEKKEVATRPEVKVKKKVVAKKVAPKVEKYGLLKIDDFKKGARIVIPKLLFEATRHTFYRTSLSSLRSLLAIMKDRPTLVIRLEGHICCKKNGEDGMDFQTYTPNLSENRAKEVCLYLLRNGIAPERLTYMGFGSKRKLVEDYGSALRGLENRRVEVFIVSE